MIRIVIYLLILVSIVIENDISNDSKKYNELNSDDKEKIKNVNYEVIDYLKKLYEYVE